MDILAQGLSGRHPAAVPGTPDAIRSLSLHIGSGEHVALIGPSGSGKTTLLQLFSAALRPTRGQLLLNHQDPATLSKAALQTLRKQLIVAPQVPPLPPRQRAITAILAGRLPQQSLLQSLASLFYPSDIPAAHDALDRFGLADKLFERVDRLSGGERQRVALARLLVSRASLWLVDEPLSALDPTRAQQAIETLVHAARDRGVTLVVTLHQVETALQYFPRVLALKKGELAFDLPASEVDRAKLQQLYGDQAYELEQPAILPEGFAPGVSALPQAMPCR